MSDVEPGPGLPPPPDPADVRAEVQSQLSPLREELARSAEESAENRAWLAEKRSRGIDQQTKDLLDEAANSPDAPDSLRKVAEAVRAGDLTWDEVFGSERDHPLAVAFREDAMRTAREHFEDADLPLVQRDPEGDAEADPEAVDEEIRRVREEAKAAHDAIWMEDLR